jgi:hypothetical protein
MSSERSEIQVAISQGMNRADAETLTSSLAGAGFKVTFGGLIATDFAIPQIWLDLILDSESEGSLQRFAIALEDGTTSLWQAAFDRGVGLAVLRLEVVRADGVPMSYVIPPGAKKAVQELHLEFGRDSILGGARYWNQNTGWGWTIDPPQSNWRGVEAFPADRFAFNFKERDSGPAISAETAPFTLTGLVEEAFKRKRR